MKNLAESIRNFDREQARRVAHNLPEQYTEREQTQQVAQIINGLFVQLAAAFPASLVNRSQEDVNEIRRQWVLAFKENGITTLEQVEAGMRMVRRQERPFLPSPGQFIAWCREGHGALGITVDDVMSEYWRWRKLVFRYPTSEQYPWSQPVLYHICLNCADAVLTASSARKSLFALLAIYSTTGKCVFSMGNQFHQYVGH